MDGARLANAVAVQGCAPADVTWRAGVDALSFGFTKNGAMMAEAIVFFGGSGGSGVRELKKRGGHLLSKGRFVAAQIRAMLKDDLWLANRSEEHTSDLQSLMRHSYADFCLKKKTIKKT